MKIGFLLLMALTLTGGAAFADAPFNVTNPSFEDSTITWQEPDYWTFFAGGGAAEPVYHEGDPANANPGEDYVEIINNGTGWAGIHMDLGQEVDVSFLPWGPVKMTIWARSADGSTITNGLVMKLEFYATQGEGYVPGTTPFVEWQYDLTGEYQLFSLYVPEVPAGMNYARGVLVVTSEQAGAGAYVDDMRIGDLGCYDCPDDFHLLRDPYPANNAVIPYDTVTELLWKNPWSLNLSDALTVDVKFEQEPGGVFDPNWTNPSTAGGIHMASVALASMTNPPTLPLPDEGLYSWQVTVHDPHTNGNPVVIEGPIWLFQVGDCPYDIVGDVDKNCKVDLGDVVLMAANWLLDCIDDPTDPACVVPLEGNRK